MLARNFIAGGAGAFVALVCGVACNAILGDLRPAPAEGGAADHEPPAECRAGDAASLPGYLTLTDAVRVCSMEVACPGWGAEGGAGPLLGISISNSYGIGLDPFSFPACVSGLTSRLPTDLVVVAGVVHGLRCVAAASNCAQANACMPVEYIGDDARCANADGGFEGTQECTTQGVLTCTGLESFPNDCSNASLYGEGSRCENVFASDDAGKALVCLVASGTCSFPSPPLCQGGFYLTCTPSGHYSSINCALSGLTCDATTGVPWTDVWGGCVAKDAGCGGLDCAALGGTCIDDRHEGLPTPHCKYPCETCSPYDSNMGKCTGDTISLCVDGQPTRFDCTSASMICVTGDGGGSGYCAPR